MQKAIENPDFVQDVNFYFTDTLEDHGTNYLLIFIYSCEKKCASRDFEGIAV